MTGRVKSKVRHTEIKRHTMSKSSHPSTVAGTSQVSFILRYLLLFKNAWVPAYELAKVGGSICLCNRIRDARKRGYKIINRVTRGPHNIAHSEYKLVTKKG
jgi:hypothetical protein